MYADEAHGAADGNEMICKHHRFPARTAHGPESSLQRARRSFMGNVRVDRVQSRGVGCKNLTNKISIKFANATSDFDQPEAPLEVNFYDKSDASVSLVR
jgi:hypothetical protein